MNRLTEAYIVPTLEMIELTLERRVLTTSDEVTPWGGEGAGDEPQPGF